MKSEKQTQKVHPNSKNLFYNNSPLEQQKKTLKRLKTLVILRLRKLRNKTNLNPKKSFKLKKSPMKMKIQIRSCKSS